MDRWMDDMWMHAWMDRWMDDMWMHAWMDRWMDDMRMHAWMDRWMDDMRMHTWMDRWMDESESVSHSVVSDSLRPPWTIAHQASLSMVFSRQECWSGLPFASRGNLPDPGIRLTFLVSST